MHVELLIGNRR